MTALVLTLAALVGVALGLLGGGGSILTVPIFVYALGFEAKPAIAMSLVVVGAASAIGTVGHWRAGNVQWKVALAFGASAMAGTALGARLALLVSGGAQLTLFALVMVVASIAMLRDTPAINRDAAVPLPTVRLVSAGIGVGILTGLVGIGGGFLIVPALVAIAHLPMQQAVGTSLLIISANAVVGVAAYAGQVPIAWEIVAIFTTMAIGGLFAGIYLSQFVSQLALKRGFAVFLLVTGAGMIFQNRHILFPH